jgi:hypothetical protein
MGRADELRGRQEAELAVVQWEDRLLELKADPAADPAELASVKLQLRQARQAHRSLREAATPEVTAVDGMACPAPVQAKAGVRRPGGER